MTPGSILVLVLALFALWTLQVPISPAQVPTEEELKAFERQAEELEKKQAEEAAQAEAKRKTEAKEKAAAAEAKREAARKEAEEEEQLKKKQAKEVAQAEARRRAEAAKKAEEERRAAEESRSARPESDGRGRATEAGSALAGEFVDIPGGTFEMASPGGVPWQTVGPAQTVSIKPFRMGKYEVTVGQFRRFVEASRYRTDAYCEGWFRSDAWYGGRASRLDWRNPGFAQTERHPVVCVSSNDAKNYALWLSQQGGGHYRLPSESEWEYAARAGVRGRYSFGDSEKLLCQYGNVANPTVNRSYVSASCYDGAKYTTSVGGYRPNGFGLYDMHGNVSEWTEDCYYKSSAPSDGTAWNPGGCARRVIRGISFWDDASREVRLGSISGGGDNTVGFRLAQDR